MSLINIIKKYEQMVHNLGHYMQEKNILSGHHITNIIYSTKKRIVKFYISACRLVLSSSKNLELIAVCQLNHRFSHRLLIFKVGNVFSRKWQRHAEKVSAL